MTLPPILVPRRADNGIRDTIWAHLRQRWEALGYPVVEGHHDEREGPFNRSRAINRAARAAGGWDVALILDGDVWVQPHQLEGAEMDALSTGRLAFGHTAWWCTTAATRDAILNPLRLQRWWEHPVDYDLDRYDTWPDEAWSIRNPISYSCVMAVRRDLWDAVGGFDERFQGWGAEDWAWHVSCEELAGPSLRQPEPVIHLHHPMCEEARAANAHERNALHDANVQLGKAYYAARGHPNRLRRLHRQAAQERQP